MTVSKRRIIQIGNSFGLTLPAEILKALNMKKGDVVEIAAVGNQVIIKMVSQMSEVPDGVPADFCGLLEEEMEVHREAIKGLVDR